MFSLSDYNKFSRLFSINQIGTYFVVRAKKNLQCKTIKWQRRLSKNLLFGFNRKTRYALDRSIYEILQILSISLTDKTHLKDLFNKTKFQYYKELLGFNEPVLFNV